MKFKFVIAVTLFTLITSNLQGDEKLLKDQNQTPRLVVERINSSDFPKMRAIIQVEQAGATVKGLGREQFQVFADGLEVADCRFSTFFSSRQWLAIAIALDVSGSMSGVPIESAKSAAIDFVSHTGVQDRVLLVTFGSKATEVVPATVEKDKIKQAVQELQCQQNTALYDAITLAADKLAVLPSLQKNLVILTDGFDNCSTWTVAQVAKQVQDKKITVYAIGLGKSINEEILKSICDTSKGKYFNAASPDELTAIYQNIARELQGSYCFEFTWPDEKRKTPAVAHTLEIKLSDNGNESTMKNQFFPANEVSGPAGNSPSGQVFSTNKPTMNPSIASGFAWSKLFPHLYYALLIGLVLAIIFMLIFRGSFLLNLLILLLTESLFAILLVLWKMLK